MQDHSNTPEQSISRKLCVSCLQMKDADQFGKRKDSPNGLANQCKPCASEHARQYHLDNKERSNKRSREYRLANKDRVSEYAKEWKRRSRDKTKVYEQNRRSRLLSSGSIVTHEDWQAVLSRFDGKCAKCGSASNIHMDHVVPLAKGGGHSIDNIQPLCQSCNLAKGVRIKDYRK